MSKIFIDPGHGGKDPGASGYNLLEKVVNLNVALVVGEILVEHGVSVVFSRKTDVFIELIDRSKAANKTGADYFVSIHSNASNGQGYGVETFYYSGSSKGKQLAQNIQKAIVSAGLSRKDRGVKTAAFSVLKNTKMPAALVELGFIDNKEDNTILLKKQNELGVAVAKGILKQLGISYKPPVTPPVKPPVTPPVTPPSSKKYYRVSVGSFKDYKNATARKEAAIKAGFKDAYISQAVVNGAKLYRIVIGAYSVYDNATATLKKAKAAGFNDAFIYRQ